MKLSVLIVDHSPSFCASLSAMLPAGVQMEVVASVSSASGELLEYLLQRSPDILCLNIDMPGLDAIEVTRQLSIVRPQIKIIGVSAHARRRVIMEMLDAGAAGFVSRKGGGGALLRAILGVGRYENTYLCPKVAADVLAVLRARQQVARSLSAAARLRPEA